MIQACLVVFGGGLGSLLRYWLTLGAYFLFGHSFPYGTLLVNTLGSFVAGFFAILLFERLTGQSDYLRAFILVGFLGGFTTFSSFSFETFTLFERGELLKASLNIIFSVVICMLAVAAGAVLARQLEPGRVFSWPVEVHIN